MGDKKVFSVCVAFKDWGLDRLEMHLASYVSEVLALGGEVIVADYSSERGFEVREIAERHGATYHLVQDNHPWSKARALNAGLSAASGDIFMTTDADMVFKPGTLTAVLEEFLRARPCVMNLQCRDLGPEIAVSDMTVREGEPTGGWAWVEAVSKLRPRWGVGGLVACSREAFLRVRGLDERMYGYGSEDLDFVQRLQRSGLKHRWVLSDEARMYHVWHPPTRRIAESTEDGKKAVDEARLLLVESTGYVRNTQHWDHAPRGAKPLASVVIATRNRSEFILDCVYSVLSQTARDIEVIVVDDGSTDDTPVVLSSVEDERLRVFRVEAAGVAAARNFATKRARADWIVIMDDDDIMLPTRIEDHFAALEGGMVGTYGGWIDFKDGSLDEVTVFPGRDFDSFAVRAAGETLVHGTSMIARTVLEQLPYNEGYRSGTDFNLFTRITRMGGVLGHTGRIAILRRLHDKQLTHADADYQKASWVSTKALGVFSMSLPQFKFELKSHLAKAKSDVCDRATALKLLHRYGPSGQARRWMTFAGRPVNGSVVTGADTFVAVSDEAGVVIWCSVRVPDPSWRDIWATGGFGCGVSLADVEPRRIEWSWQILAGRIGAAYCAENRVSRCLVSEDEREGAVAYSFVTNTPFRSEGEIFVEPVAQATETRDGPLFLEMNLKGTQDVLVSLVGEG